MEKFLYQPIKKQPKINVWFAHPTIESFALSSLGFMSIFKMLDLMEDVRVERIYTDKKLTEIPAKDVDVIGFSTSFEIDILAVINILNRYKIPVKSNERKEDDPIVFGGGPVLTANPLPYSEIYDFVMVGDAIESFAAVMAILVKFKDLPKREILAQLNKLKYVWVPAFGIKKVKKHSDILKEPFAMPVLSDKSFFKKTFIIEIERGCPKMCNFCIASWLNLRPRFVGADKIIEAINFGLQHTNKIALLGAYVAGHPEFERILEYIRKRNAQKPVELTLSSLRADLTNGNVIKTLVECGQKTATIAIEAGSERLRKIINKDLTEAQILKTIETARVGGLKGLKIYIMIGHFGEIKEDIEALVDLTKKIKAQNKGFDISYSLATFTPKAHTPFQSVRREGTKNLEDKINYLKKQMHKLGVQLRPTSVAWDDIQALLSRYDKPLSDYFIEVVKKGGNLGAFKHVWREFHKKGLLGDFDETVQMPFSGDTLPWGFIETGYENIALKCYKKAQELSLKSCI